MNEVKVVYGMDDKLEVTKVTASYGEIDVFGKNFYKYAEDRIIADLHDYIDNTYGEHYKTEDHNIECFDVWIALGESTPTFRNTALKYLWRYGKKSGSNKADLMKALHYTMMCLYVDHYKDDDNGN
jgi:hypothetical protein